MSKITPNNYQQAVDSFKAQEITHTIPSEINECDKGHYHILAVKTKLQNMKAVHNVRTLKYNPKSWAQVQKNTLGKLGYNFFAVLHNPTKPLVDEKKTVGLDEEQKDYIESVQKAVEQEGENGEFNVKEVAKFLGVTQKLVKEYLSTLK